jgi:adenylate cyclase
LLAVDAGAAEGRLSRGFEGRERLITVVFVDIRGSTTSGEAKLPYDVLFILNQFFQEMNGAIAATRGHYSQFTGDRLMALYGPDAADPAVGAGDAARGARARKCPSFRCNSAERPAAIEPAASAAISGGFVFEVADSSL